jgi:hypothetical protein
MKTKSILAIACLMLATAGVNAQEKKAAEAKPVVNAVQATPAATTPVNPNAAEFKFEAMEYNYGSIKQGEVVNHEFKFTNSGKEPLIIQNASGSCGCTVPDWPKDPIKPGASGVIKVTFNSAGKSGSQDKTVTINSNAKTSPLVLHIKGNVEMPAATPASTNPSGVKVEPVPAKKQ